MLEVDFVTNIDENYRKQCRLFEIVCLLCNARFSSVFDKIVQSFAMLASLDSDSNKGIRELVF